VTPDDRHYGRKENILTKLRQMYKKARCRHPNRWSRHTGNWNPLQLVWLNPENKDDVCQKHRLKKAALMCLTSQIVYDQCLIDKS